MAIFYDEQSKIFYLESKETTYAFGINKLGILEHLYFGKRVGRDLVFTTYSEKGRSHAVYVFDEDGVYIYDGTEFHFLYSLGHTAASLGNIEDAKKLSTHAEKLVLSELTPVASFEKQP